VKNVSVKRLLKRGKENRGLDRVGSEKKRVRVEKGFGGGVWQSKLRINELTITRESQLYSEGELQ